MYELGYEPGVWNYRDTDGFDTKEKVVERIQKAQKHGVPQHFTSPGYKKKGNKDVFLLIFFNFYLFRFSLSSTTSTAAVS